MLLEKWYLKCATLEERTILFNWLPEDCKYSLKELTSEFCYPNFGDYKRFKFGHHTGTSQHIKETYKQISFREFEQYVLKREFIPQIFN